MALPLISVHQSIDLGHEVPEWGTEMGLTDASQHVLHSEATCGDDTLRQVNHMLDMLRQCKHFMSDGLS